MSPVRFAFVTLLIALCLPRPAAAEDDARARAKAAFGEGQRAFEAKDYAAALTHFRSAFDLHRHDAVRFNIAVCLEKLGKNRDALLEYEAAAKSDQLDDAARARARELTQRARMELGTLAVEGTPTGADVLVDGEQLCNLPCSVSLDPVRHEVEVRSGAQSDRRSVVITKQETRRISVALGGSTVDEAPKAKAAAPSVRVEPARDSAAVSGGGPGWLTWTGAGLVVLGGTGIALFGSQAKSHHDDWIETGNPSAKDDGIRARNLTNVAVGVAVVGAVAVGIDLVLLAPGRKKTATATRRQGLRFEF